MAHRTNHFCNSNSNEEVLQILLIHGSWAVAILWKNSSDIKTGKESQSGHVSIELELRWNIVREMGPSSRM